MTLDIRLQAAADMIPQGARLADIGTDHAYLPICLCLEGKIKSALASDINEGPIRSAEANIKKNCLCDRIDTVCADGLSGAEDFAPDCIAILGMGGELIVSILDRAEWVKNEKITLVLQPMTHSEILTKYLCQKGFYIENEQIVCDGGRDDRLYRLISAKFDGKAREITDFEALVGAKNLKRADENTKKYVLKTKKTFEAVKKGKSISHADTGYEEKIICEAEKYLEK